MSRLALIVVCFNALFFERAGAESTFPYVAYVGSQNTFARSGPGQQYYPTLQLSQGHAVEVYRHDRGGWCAVRPPEGSYSFIAAHEVHRLSPSLAEVAVESTVARVGSSVAAARNDVQVMLRRGEKLQILPAAPNDDPRWLRIAPPAGEFRWIAASGLSRTPPMEGNEGVQLASKWMRQSEAQAIRQTSNDSADAFAHLLDSTAPGPTNNVAANEPQASNAVGSANSDGLRIVADSPAEQELGRGASLAPPPLLDVSTPLPTQTASTLPITSEPRSSTAPRVRFGNAAGVVGPGSQRVQELQVRLSQVVVQPKEEWRFEQIESEAKELLEKSDSVEERQHLRDLMDRIARFRGIQRSAPVTSSRSNQDFTGLTEEIRNLVSADLAGSDPFEAKPRDPNAPRYDAVGRLKPVVSQADGAPRYALVDDRGTVVSFVTPSPDLNLQPYLGMRIGVNGSRGFMPEYRKAHVTAGRVTPIEDRIRR